MADDVVLEYDRKEDILRIVGDAAGVVEMQVAVGGPYVDTDLWGMIVADVIRHVGNALALAGHEPDPLEAARAVFDAMVQELSSPTSGDTRGEMES